MRSYDFIQLQFFLLEATFGLWVLSLSAYVCVCIRVSKFGDPGLTEVDLTSS